MSLDIKSILVVIICLLMALGSPSQAFCGSKIHNHAPKYKTMDNSIDHRMDYLLDAIYISEGGSKAKVPYGLVNSSWCMDEPGWCRYYAGEVIRVHHKRWMNNHIDLSDNILDPKFLHYLASKYAPIGANNDPRNLNNHWEKNVKYYLETKI